ncbi:MAG: CFI-box-CTERM domain-containing protein, partial [Planctomycetota bacterium]
SDCRVLDNPSPADAADGVDFQYGFFEFTVNNIAAGGATTVTLYLADGAGPNTYYKYGPTPDDPTDHWYEFIYDDPPGEKTGAEIDGNVITLHFKDGQRGDDDLAANGIVMDQGGPGFTSTGGTTVGGGGGSSGGGCFIATAAFGSPMEKHVTILEDFRDTYFLPCALGRIFIRTYNKYSPQLAHLISRHETLKVAVRIGLMPLVAVSYSALHFGPIITLTMLVGLLAIPIFLVSFYRRKDRSHRANN